MSASDFFLSLFASLIGFAYFVYGRRARDPLFIVAGVALMVCVYLVDGLWLQLGLAMACGAAPFALRRFL